MSNEQSAQPSKFIFFGCWNNINCDSEFMYRDIVLDYIKENESDVKQLYIAGDNWYTNKKTINEKELKLYITEVLRTGYDKLYSMGKDIHIAVGNHDIDSNISVGKKLGSAKSPRIPQIPESASSLRIPEIPRSASSPQSVSSSGSASSSQGVNTRKELKKDCNINTQKYYLRKIKNGTKKFETPTLESLREMKDTELSEVALHNQGIYIYVENIGVCDNNDYIVIIINTNKFDDFDEGMLYLEEIREVIKRVKGSESSESSESGKQIFVMGHIPLFTNKKNKLSIHDITKKDSRFKEITYKLFDILTEHNIIYLCADTHNFSIMKITHNGKVLIQITAGTGGADPDLIDENPKTEKTENVKDGYEITAYSINSYGYASINISKGQIDVCYTQVIKAPLPEKSSYTSVQKITYKITKQDPYLTYEHNIEERDYPNNANDANNPIYKPTNICKKINDDTGGYITGKEGKLFCYKKKIKKINKDKE